MFKRATVVLRISTQYLMHTRGQNGALLCPGEAALFGSVQLPSLGWTSASAPFWVVLWSRAPRTQPLAAEQGLHADAKPEQMRLPGLLLRALSSPHPHLFLYLLTPCNLPVTLVEGKPLPEQEKQEHHLLHTDNGDSVCGVWVRSSSVQLPVWGPPRKHRALLSALLLPSHQSSSTLKVLTD